MIELWTAVAAAAKVKINGKITFPFNRIVFLFDACSGDEFISKKLTAQAIANINLQFSLQPVLVHL